MGGFYGNMTNSVKTSLTFDKKYSSRKAMDKGVLTDGIYAGRYVLVEYSLDWSTDIVSNELNNSDLNYVDVGYYRTSDGSSVSVLYKDRTCTQAVRPENGGFYYVKGYRKNSTTVIDCDELWFFNGSKYNLLTTKVSDGSASNNYVANFNIDKEVYGESRGYDSTVWTKVYDKDGKPSYVMIAELNAIVPTFNLTADAPSEEPIAPYFSTLGSNIYYDMHVLTPWGFEVGDIEYNKAGFSENNRVIDNSNDFIKITNKKSGKKYNGTVADDIKLLSMNLPSIGNMVAEGWDVIHGPDRDDNPTNSLQGRLNFFKDMNNNEIPVQSQEQRLVGATMGGDNWIECEIDSSKNEGHKIQITHKESSQDSITVGNVSKSFQFGDSFNIPRLTTDKAGHITEASDQSITLPKGSYTAASSATESTEVITGIGFTDTTGAITSTKANSSTLKLASYNINNLTSGDNISDGDTYNTAFAKLQNQINNLDYDESSTTKIITKITQTNGLVGVTFGNAGSLLLTDYVLGNNSNDIAATDSLNTAFAKLQKQIHDEESARADAINDLDLEKVTLGETEVFESITQENGKVRVTSKSASELQLSNYAIAKEASSINNDDTLNTAFGKIEYKLDSEINRAKEEEKSIRDIINGLDYTNSNNGYQVINKIEQTDGKISVSFTDIEGIKLKNKPESSLEDNSNYIQKDDTLLSSFNKLQSLINTNKDSIGNKANGDTPSTGLYAFIDNVASGLVKTVDIENVLRDSTEFVYNSEEITNEETGEVEIHTNKVTINGLIEIINNLEDRIILLENTIEELKPKEENGSEPEVTDPTEQPEESE